MPSYYDPNCDTYSLSQRLIIPTNPQLEFVLNPDDLTYQDQEADASIAIKYARFTRTITAVVPTFTVSLYGLTAAEVLTITEFTESDMLNNVLSTGRGSISLYYMGEELTGLYIQPPIEKSSSIFRNWERPTPTEVFDRVSLTLISPNPRWS